MIASGIQPIQNLSVMRRHSSDPVAQSEWGHHWIQKGFDKLELVVSKTAGTYCFGGTLTFADICLVPQVFNANRFKVDMDQYPTLKRINAHCLTLKACDAAAPHNQPGAC